MKPTNYMLLSHPKIKKYYNISLSSGIESSELVDGQPDSTKQGEEKDLIPTTELHNAIFGIRYSKFSLLQGEYIRYKTALDKVVGAINGFESYIEKEPAILPLYETFNSLLQHQQEMRKGCAASQAKIDEMIDEYELRRS